MTPYQQFIHKSRYARFLAEENRREEWHETVDRYMRFMRENLGDSLEDSVYEECHEAILNLEVMPSMRLMMTAGDAARRSNIACFNCAFVAIDDPKAFDEALYVLMNGTGVGFSVEHRHVDKLPEVPEKLFDSETTIVVRDSKEGWAKAYRQLLSLLWAGEIPKYDLSRVRPAGARLKTFGGRASGPEPLRSLFAFTIKIFKKAVGRKLTTEECHDLVCKVADVVVVGGVRRSALISLSDLNDTKMAKAKSGSWYEDHPHRRLANNSAVYRTKPTVFEFTKEWLTLMESGSGERGIFNHTAIKKQVDSIGRKYNEDMGTNPSLRAGTLVLTSAGVFPIEELENKGNFLVPTGYGVEASAFCRLSSPSARLYEIKFASGRSVFATAEHKWDTITLKEKKTTLDLECGDKIPTGIRRLPATGSEEDVEFGFFAGYWLGNGWSTTRSDNGETQYGICLPKHRMEIRPRLLRVMERIGVNSTFSERSNGTYEFNTTNKKLKSFLDACGLFSKYQEDFSKVWKNSGKFLRGLLEGLVASDGYRDNRRVRFSSKNKALRDLVADLAYFSGFKPSLRQKTTDVTFTKANGKTYNYPSYTMFRCEWGLGSGKRTTYDTVVSVEDTGRDEPVWDLTVSNETHTFVIAGMVTGNCCEIILNKNSFCNLTTSIVRPTDTLEDLLRKTRVATILGTYQATLTDFPYLRKEWRTTAVHERLLGVSMTGVMDNPLLNGTQDNLAEVLEALKAKARETNKEFAAKMGITESHAITAIKPEGCQHVETLVSTSEGIIELGEMGNALDEEFREFNTNIEVLTDSGSSKSTAYKGNGYALTKLIELNSGLYLEATPNHQYRVLRDNEYIWVRADKIEEGDKIPYRVGGYNKETEQPLVEPSFVYKRGHWKGNKGRKRPLPKTPSAMNADLAWLLGVYTGDGSNHRSGIRIHCSYDLEHVSKIARIVKDQFGITARLDVKPQGKNMIVVYISSRALLDWLKANDLSKKKSPDIEIPYIIRTSSSTSLSSFLSGYHAADGCDAPAGRTFCTVSYKMAKQVVVCLRSLGIDASLRKMPPTESSKGSRMRYWIAERKGLEGHWVYTTRGRDIQVLQDLGMKNLLFDTVVAVSDSMCLTADLSVPENNTYLANSYVSHNTTSQLCNTASGLHGQHARFYLRTVRQDNKDPLTEFLKQKGFYSEPCCMSPDTTTVFYFPVKASEVAILRDELSALEHLELWKKYQIHYCEHKPSVTISVKDSEWLSVGAWVYENWDYMTGVSFLPYFEEDTTYKQLPYQTITESEYEAWLEKMPKGIDWIEFLEYDDNVKGVQQLACSSGYCEI